MSIASGVLLGTVKVPPSLLYYIQATEARPPNPPRADPILPRNTTREDRAEQYPVDGYIDYSQASSVFNELKLSPLELAQCNSQGTYPALRTQVIGYMEGRCQVEAATKRLPALPLVVHLFCVDLTRAFLVDLTATSPHNVRPNPRGSCIEGSYPDGYVYARLREHKNDQINYGRWYGELNAKKKRVVKLIQGTPIEAALDCLSVYGGLIDSLQLTVYERLLSLRLEDEIVAGIRSIHRYWSKLLRFAMLGPPDKHTVAVLEGRAPAISELDRQMTRRAFGRGEVFGGIQDPVKRKRVEQGILATSTMIPGVESFQANLSFLAIAADIIWTHLLPANLRKTPRGDRHSLKTILRSCWVESKPYVEVQEGLFQPLRGRPSFQLAYDVLILSTIRQFPYLSDKKPYSEPDLTHSVHTGDSMALDNNCVFLLHRRARLLGFRTWKIDQGAAVPAAPFEPILPPGTWHMEGEGQSSFYSRPGRRSGKPFRRAFRLMQMKAFLPTISTVAVVPKFSVTAVLRNFMATFFDCPHMDFDLALPPVSINSGLASGFVTVGSSSFATGSVYPCVDLTGEQGSCGSEMDVDSRSDSVLGTSPGTCTGSDSDIIMQEAPPASEASLMDVDMDEAVA